VSRTLTGTGPHNEPRVAVFSDDEAMMYRYYLEIGNHKQNDQTNGVLIFIGMNPSTADQNKSDATITRLENRMRQWNHYMLVVLNVYAIRETDSKKLPQYEDIIGPENDAIIRRALSYFPLEGTKVLCGWGDAGHRNGRGLTVHRMIRNAGHKPLCFGTNAKGGAKHPLYVPYTQAPERYWVEGE
jgi:hypothetical protein